MPIKFNINKRRGFMISYWVGEIDDHLFVKSFMDLVTKNKDWTPGLNHIADITGADLSKVSGKGIKKLAELMNRTTVMNSDCTTNRVAIVVTDPNSYDIMRVYKAFFSKSNRDMELFDGISSAIEWLNRDPRIK